MYFNYKIQITFQNSIPNTFFNYFCCVEQSTNTKYTFVKVFEIQNNSKVIAVEDKPNYFITL